MKWEFEGNIPIYLQIVSNLKEQIASGQCPPGSKMPSVRELALEAGVNPNTVQRAFAQLEQDGLLHTERTSGRNVTEDTEILKELRNALAEKAVDEMVQHLRVLGMNEEEITEIVQERIGKDKV